MKLTAKVQLRPTEEQDQLLRETLVQTNRACNYVSERAWQSKTFGKFRLQKLVYRNTREKFDLSAQVVVRLIAKVSDAYKLDRKTKRKFKDTGAIAYDNRILNYRLKDSAASIWCVGGRQVVPFVCGERQRELLAYQKGESDLALIQGQWYLFAACEIEEPSPKDVDDVLGVDLGIVNIATDSDGKVYSSKELNSLRARHRKFRSKLQSIGTQSAKRLLEKRSKKESNFATNTNHVISKHIVEMAKDTGRAIALEDLSGIRDRTTVVRKAQRATMSSWSFYQLRNFIEYKAHRIGVPVILVDPRNTSCTCPACGCIDKANRKSQSQFSCTSCGFSGLADVIAAVNISRQGRVMLPYIPRPIASPSGGAGTSPRPAVVGS
jgi:IS605 OrfB family transposase